MTAPFVHATRPTQPPIAARPATGWSAMARGLAVAVVGVVGVMGLAGCASGPPAPDWAVLAQDAHQRGTAAHLQGETRAAEADWARARQAVARTADPNRVLRVALAQCAARVASLGEQRCTEPLASWADDVSPDLSAYARYLDATATDADVPRLPAAQQAVAALLRQPPAPDRDAALAQRLAQQPDALSRLVGAAVAWRAGQAGPQVVALALDTATEQGWRRPLLAWLTVAVAQAERAGDREQVQRLQRRLTLLAPVQPAQAPLAP